MATRGERLADRYELGDELGQGGMGTVFAARDAVGGETVAVKVLRPLYARDPTAVERLRREARLAAALDSPHVVRVLDVQEAQEPFLVMEYVPGPTLAQVLARRGTLTPGEAVAVAADVARALAAAHTAGMVHRDLKPANIKLYGDRATVLDFGIARAADDISLTVTGTFLGTPAYTAPERMDGRSDIRSDIYSLGVLLFRMLAGSPPFDAPTPWALLHAQRTQAPPPLPEGVPAPLRAVVLRCLAKAPEERYQTPAELLDALLAAAPPDSAIPGMPEEREPVGGSVGVTRPAATSAQADLPTILEGPE